MGSPTIAPPPSPPPGFKLIGDQPAHPPPPPGFTMLPSGGGLNSTDEANAAMAKSGISVSPPNLPLPGNPTLPPELRAPTDQPTGFGMSTRNPRTGQQVTERSAAARVPIIDAPTSGVQDIGQGMATMSDPSWERKAHGAHQILGGLAQVATPVAAVAGAANLAPAIIGMGTGLGVQKGVQTGLEAAGVPEGYSELVGDVTGGAAGTYAAGKTPQIADALSRSAANNYRSVLLPSSKRLVPKANETASLMAEQKPIALTRNSLLQQAKTNKAVAGPLAGTAYDAQPPVPQDAQASIFDALDRLEQRHVQVKGSSVEVNPNLKTAIQGLRQNLMDMRDDLGNIPAATLDDFRDKLYRGDVDATGNIRANAPASAKAIEKSTASSIRRVLDDRYPDAKALNDSYKLWANAENFLEDANNREVASKSGIVTGSSQGFGALVQRAIPRPVREIPGKILGVFDSVAWNTVSGAVKQSLAEAMAKQNWGVASDIVSGLPKTTGLTGPNPNPRQGPSMPPPPVDTAPKLLGSGPPRMARGGVVVPTKARKQLGRYSRRGVWHGAPGSIPPPRSSANSPKSSMPPMPMPIPTPNRNQMPAPPSPKQRNQ